MDASCSKTNLSVLSRASSPNGKVPRNWHVGHRCCLYRTMTCRNLCVWKLRHFTISTLLGWRRSKPAVVSPFTPQPLLFSSSSLCLFSPTTLTHSLFGGGEVLSLFSPLFSSYRCRRAASALNMIVSGGGGCAAAVRLWEVLRSRVQGDWQRIQPIREELKLPPPVSCCWSIFDFFFSTEKLVIKRA